jgi:hypothetical protein
MMFPEFREHFVVERHLVATNRAPVGRIEGEDDWPSLKFGSGDGLVGSDLELEFRSASAGGKDRVHTVSF